MSTHQGNCRDNNYNIVVIATAEIETINVVPAMREKQARNN